MTSWKPRSHCSMQNTEAGLIIFQVIKNITSCSRSSLSYTSFFTKSATNSTQAIISMSGKTKEMASRYLGNTEMSTVSQISRKPNVQSLSRTADEKTYHSVTGLTERQRCRAEEQYWRRVWGFLTAVFLSSIFYSLSIDLRRYIGIVCFPFDTAIFHSYHVRNCVVE